MASTGTAADAGYVSDAVTAINTSLGLRPKTIKMNGATKTVASSTVDLGNVVVSLTDSAGTAVPITNGVIALPASVGTLTTTSATTNLHTEDFATDTSNNWVVGNTATAKVTRDTSTSAGDAASMKITWQVASTGTTFASPWVPGVTAGHQIRLTCWFNIPTGESMTLGMRWLNSSYSATTDASTATMTGTGAWTSQTITYTAPSTAVQCYAYLVSSAGTATAGTLYHIDNVAFDDLSGTASTTWSGGGSVTTATTNYASAITN